MYHTEQKQEPPRAGDDSHILLRSQVNFTGKKEKSRFLHVRIITTLVNWIHGKKNGANKNIPDILK